MLHEDGRPYGWRALVPYARVAAYQRVARFQPNRDGSGAAGEFGRLLQSHPALDQWIAGRVRDKRISVKQISTDEGLRVRLLGLKHLHADFLSQCRRRGLTAADYPLNTDRGGIRSRSRGEAPLPAQFRPERKVGGSGPPQGIAGRIHIGAGGDPIPGCR
jgi:hypothetical protein